MNTPAVTSRATRGRWRLVRVAALGGSSTALAVAAHMVGAGEPPDAVLFVSMLALTGLIGLPLTARRCRLPLVAAVLAAEQGVLHWLLGTLGTGGCGASHPHSAAGSAHVVLGASCDAAVGHPTHAAMLVAHAAATLLTAWLLTKAEGAIWSLTELVVAAAAPSTTPWPEPAGTVAVWASTPEFPVTGRTPAAPRGPPRGGAC